VDVGREYNGIRGKGKGRGLGREVGAEKVCSLCASVGLYGWTGHGAGIPSPAVQIM